MQCPICSSENAAGVARCATCGATLASDHGPNVLPAGTLLHHGTYAIVSCLGQGGFGITYLATDQKLRRPVCIKEFFPSGCVREGASVRVGGGWTPDAYADGRARFLQEGEALARFDHPGIVRVYGAFEANGTAYLAMEFLQGKSLEEILAARGGRLPVAEARVCAVRIAEALEVVHGAGLLHRDVKPANVMVVGSDSFLANPRVVLVDFGTAREFAAGVSQSHSVVLTVGYAPLEQYAQRASRGPYTDLYALCALLYRALTGAPPPDAHDRVYGGALKPVAEANPGVDPALAHAITRGLEMDAGRRPQTVRELLAEMGAAALPPGAGSASPTTVTGAPASRPGAGSPVASGPGPALSPSDAGQPSGAAVPPASPPTVVAGAGVGVGVGAGISARGNTAGPSPAGAPSGSATGGSRATRGALAVIALLAVLLVGWALSRGQGGASKAPVASRPGISPSDAVTPSGLEAAGVNAKGFPEFRNPKDGTVLVRIPGGTFRMGSNDGDRDEKPVHSVTLQAYLIARVPVTNAQFARFVSASGYDAGSSWRDYASKWGNNAPVVCVSWNDATAYATWADLRLPSEEEWELAARGPESLVYPWGNDWDGEPVLNNPGKPAPVGSFPSGASPFGCLDMAGNVWQWTASWYDRHPGNTDNDSAYGQMYRGLRGGSWSINDPWLFRGANRGWNDADRRNTIIGLRVARTL